MSADSVALLRVRVKRRKRRPMNDLERFATLVASFHALMTFGWLLVVLLASGAVRWVGLAEVALMLFWAWVPVEGNAYRILINYIVNGYEDDL